MKKKVEIKFSDEAKAIYDQLGERAQSSKVDRMLLDAIDKKLDLIRANCFYGNIIPKRFIPEQYKKKYAITNLLRVELPCFWRMLYALGDDEEQIVIIAFIVDILNHKDYNKKFVYKKH